MSGGPEQAPWYQGTPRLGRGAAEIVARFPPVPGWAWALMGASLAWDLGGRAGVGLWGVWYVIQGRAGE